MAGAGQPSGLPGPLAQAAGEAVFATGVITALVVLFRERFDRQGAAGRFLSRQAYAVYVLHALVLVALGHAFAGFGAIAVAKFALVAALAVPLCWIVAAAARTLPAVRRVV